MNYVTLCFHVSDSAKLHLRGHAFPRSEACKAFGSVVLATEEFGNADLELRSTEPAALRAIASRLFHEAAKLEKVQRDG